MLGALFLFTNLVCTCQGEERNRWWKLGSGGWWQRFGCGQLFRPLLDSHRQCHHASFTCLNIWADTPWTIYNPS